MILSSCVPFRPPNRPLERVDPSYGYRPMTSGRQRDPGRVWIILAFSGGGTRAASFAYGVLEELRDTKVVMHGETVRLLDEVDTISGVSGGSFPAAYYGLFGDRIFAEFEERFLKRNVQRALVLQTLNPWNALRLPTPLLTRSDLAARYYDRNVFEGATFADLDAAHGPRIHINATDLVQGNTVRFTQGGFDVFCSDLGAFKIAYAVAASSAVPILLSPVTLKNYAGGCGFETPEWFEEALRSRRSNPRAYRAAAAFAPYLNRKAKPYIHLVDGGVSDNLGLRPLFDLVEAMGGIEETLDVSRLRIPDRIVFIVVNAETEPDPAFSLDAAAPSTLVSLNLVTGAQIRRYNFETLLLARAALSEYGRTLSTPDRPVDTHFIEVSFDLLQDEGERRQLKHLPTSFALREEQVDHLRAAGRRLLAESPEFQRLLRELR